MVIGRRAGWIGLRATGQRLTRIGPLGLGLLSALARSPAAAQTRDWPPEDRALIGDFTTITAVAVSNDLVFAVTPTAVVVWNPPARRWEGPYTPPDARLLQGVFAALADPLAQGLWLGRRDGWTRFEVQLRVWAGGPVPGNVLDIALDQDNPLGGLFLRTGSGWYTVPSGSDVATPGAAPARPLRPASVQDAIRANPALEANRAAILTAGRLRSARYTAAAAASGFAGRGWYLGTAGAGLLYLAEGAALPERLRFGLPSPAVAAVYAAPTGVWVVTERTPSSDPSLSFVSARLDEFQWLQGSWASSLPFSQARALVGQGNALWLGTDAGLIRIVPSSEDVTAFDEGRGLPDNRVLGLAARRGRVAAGLAHGLVVATDSGQPERLAPDFSDEARAVLLGPGDTVWVGTRLGLFTALPGERGLRQPAALREAPSLQAPVYDLAWRGDTLVALLEDRLLWRDPGKGGYTLGPTLGNVVGRVHTLLSTPAELFVAGERGFVRLGLATPPGRPTLTPGDLPGLVTDLAADDTYLWVGTTQGLVRFRLDALPR